MSGAKEVHVKQFKRATGSHDSLRGVLESGHLSSLTSPTRMIFEEFDTLNANDVLLLRECVQVCDAQIIKLQQISANDATSPLLLLINSH